MQGMAVSVKRIRDMSIQASAYGLLAMRESEATHDARECAAWLSVANAQARVVGALNRVLEARGKRKLRVVK
jgi:hypothetical protein